MTDKEIKITKGLKTSPGLGQSKFQAELEAKRNEAKITEEFEKRAEHFIANKDSYKERSIELASKLMSAIRDKTTIDNKGVIAKEFEISLRNDINLLINATNLDPDTEPDEGNKIGFSMLFKVVFELRDRINSLEYENYKLKLMLNDIKK